jgi:hypothetical protein
MQPYGINARWHQNCCPGHDVFPKATYNNNRSKRAHTRDTAIAHRAERRRIKLNIRKAI